MKLHISNVLERAAQRGYTPDEIRPCLTEDLGGGWYEVDVKHPAYPHKKPGHAVAAVGLGDLVKSWLSSFGITEERVSAAIGRPCGCSQRAEKLNELGRKIGIG